MPVSNDILTHFVIHNSEIKPRQKRHHTKSRNGCLSCKRRHLKCNLARPTCQQCTRNHLFCQYPTAQTPIDVRRLDDGQVIVIPCSDLKSTSQGLLPTHFDSNRISFFIETSIPLLCSAGPPPELKSPGPSLFIDENGRALFENAYNQFDKVWRLFVLPQAFHEPDVFELACLFGRRHLMALTAPDQNAQLKDYARVLSIVSRMTKTRPLMVVLAGILILFAFERVQAASTDTVPKSQFFVHWSAMKQLLDARPRELEYIMPPMALLHEKMAPMFLQDVDDANSPATSTPDSSGSIIMPTEFFDCAEAATYFALILRASDNLARKREYMEEWKLAMLRYHGTVRGVDWNESKRAMTMLAEYELFSTAHELAVMQYEQGKQGRIQDAAENVGSLRHRL